MKTITLTNDFHNSSATFKLRADGTISTATYNLVRRELCGNAECRCLSSQASGNAGDIGQYEPIYDNSRIVAYKALEA